MLAFLKHVPNYLVPILTRLPIYHSVILKNILKIVQCIPVAKLEVRTTLCWDGWQLFIPG